MSTSTLSRSLFCAFVGASMVSLPIVANAQPQPEGFTCCNLRTDGSWITDANYAESHKKMIPAGTPAKVTGYGRYRVHIDMSGQKQSIGNDYSRDLEMGAFAQRYVVAEDPKVKLASWPPAIQAAVKAAKVMVGMTKDQVIMSVAYPMTSENPSLDAPVWRYWLSSFAEFQVVWDDKGRVKEITTDPQTRNLVVASP